MAELVGGLGCSHAPSIAHAFDSQEVDQPGWRPLFDALDAGSQWLQGLEPDVLVCIYNDHLNQFFFDAWPTFAIGTGASFAIADEGRSPRNLPAVPGAPSLARYLAQFMVDAGADLTVAQEQVIDHGILSPLSVLNLRQREWVVPIVPLAVNVICEPLPSPSRCWKLGEVLGEAIHAYPDPARVAVLGLGGLSHQLTGPNFGQIKPEWDREFLRLLDEEPRELARFSMPELAALGGDESVEVVQWVVMRAALPEHSRMVFSYYYPYQLMGYAVAGIAPPAPVFQSH